MTELNIQTPIADRVSEQHAPVIESPDRFLAGDAFEARLAVAKVSPQESGRKFTKAELVRAIRLDLSAEQEAVYLYLARAELTDDPHVENVLREIADEESTHVGEFARLLSLLAPEEGALMANRAREVYALRGSPADASGSRRPVYRTQPGLRYSWSMTSLI